MSKNKNVSNLANNYSKAGLRWDLELCEACQLLTQNNAVQWVNLERIPTRCIIGLDYVNYIKQLLQLVTDVTNAKKIWQVLLNYEATNCSLYCICLNTVPNYQTVKLMLHWCSTFVIVYLCFVFLMQPWRISVRRKCNTNVNVVWFHLQATVQP